MSRALASAATFSLPVMKARRSGPHFHSAGCPTTLLFCDAVIEARIGRTTNNARPTTTKFMIDAVKNMECQLPVCDFKMLASGTTNADKPFAV